MTDWLKFTLPLLGAVVAWVVNQWQQRAKEEYVRKETLYRNLLEGLQGFYQVRATTFESSTVSLMLTTQTSDKRKVFVDQVRFAWLYSPDEVILKSYSFLDMLHEKRQPAPTDQEKDAAFGDIVAAVRRDLFRPRFFFWQRTKLTGTDYRHFQVK
jgi:hypothetical protein